MASPAISRPNRRYARRTAIPALLAAIALLLAFAGCGDDDNPAGPGPGGTASTAFTGFLTDGIQSGKIVVTVHSTSLAGRPRALGTSVLGAAAPGVAASATFTIGGVTTMVSGTYDDEADTLNLAGSGYSFRGAFDPGEGTPTLVGNYVGPSGGGFWAGIGGLTMPRVYCGTWQSATPSDSGTFNFVAVDTAFAGTIVAADDMETGFFSGAVSGTGTTRDLTALEGDLATFTLEIVGTLDLTTDTTSGTYTYTSYDPAYGTDDNGTWSGELCP